MSYNYPKYRHGVGLRNVGSYQVSGHPYITGSANMGSAGTEHKILFPFVTKNVTVISSGSAGPIKVHFNSANVGDVMLGNHFITLDSDEDSITFDVKCKEIYLTNVSASTGFQLYASLTNVAPSNM